MKSLTKKCFLVLLLNVIFYSTVMSQSTEVIYRITSTKRSFDSARTLYIRLLYNDSMSFCHYLPRLDTFSMPVEKIIYNSRGKHGTFYLKNLPNYRIDIVYDFSQPDIGGLAAFPIEFKYKPIANSSKTVLSRQVSEFMIAGKDRIIGSVYCDTSIEAPFGPVMFTGTNSLVLYAIDKKRKLKFEALSVRSISEALFMPDLPIYTSESHIKASKLIQSYGRVKMQEAANMLEPFVLQNKK
jgi:hypothetical protein